MKNWFYNHTIHTHVLLFASIFDEMEVWNFDADGKAVGKIAVPVKLMYKEKVVQMLLNQNNNNPYRLRDNENVLPMISIGWRGMQLDKNRMKGMREQRRIYLEYENVAGTSRPQEKQHIDMQTVPYILNFEVIVWAKYMDHLVQLVENIDTFIHPEIYLDLWEKGLGIGRKSRVVKVSENPGFNPEIPENEMRSKFLTWSYNFDVEINLYKPEQPVGLPIKRMINRFVAVQSNAVSTGADLAEQTVTQTADVSGAQTSGTSGYCFYDYDANIVNYIRKFSDPELTQMPVEYEQFWNCQIPPSPLTPPVVTPYPPLAFGEIQVGNTDVVTISSGDLQNAPMYVPQAIINSKVGSPPFTITNFENVVPGSFQVRLSSAPPDDTYSIVWYAYQKYNSDPNSV